VVHYSGFLWNEGTQFDSSWENGQPAEFEVAEGSLISGFVKALVGQKVGSQVVAIIPPSEGYGDQGNDSIPANSTLVFVVDILGIK
jgi:peptidylprolyl isomerase